MSRMSFAASQAAAPVLVAAALAAGLATAAAGQDLIVEKKTFALPAYTTVGGYTIRNVRIGYETA